MPPRRLASLHPVNPELASQWLREPSDLQRMALAGDRAAAGQLLAGVAGESMNYWPAYLADPLSLTVWESQVDQGLATLMRAPSSFLLRCGYPRESLLNMPVRLEPGSYPTGGAWVPPERIGDFADLIDRRVESIALKLHDADVDPYLAIGFMSSAVEYALVNGVGLLEANGVVDADRIRELQSVGQVVLPSQAAIEPTLRNRIKLSLEPPEKPGRLKRLLGRG